MFFQEAKFECLSYCTSYYGCELWSLTTSNISDFCTACRRGVRAILNLPYTRHCYLLPIICQCVPLFDELCRRSINFARWCVSHESQFISHIASYCIGLHFARCNSPMGLNILFCTDRFQTNIDGILNGSSYYIVHSYYNRSIADVQLRASSCMNSLALETADNRILVTSLSPKRIWRISYIISVVI